MLDPRLQLPALLALLALATLFAWQTRQPFDLTLGTPNDDPYLRGFHAGETAPDGSLTYRWTQPVARLTIPGYGATPATLTLRLQGARPGGGPLPAVTVTLGELPPQTLPLSAEPHDYDLAVPAAAFQDGSLRVTVRSPTFQPPGDRRDLGVVAYRVTLRDAGTPAGLVAPPPCVWGALLFLALLAYATPAIALRSSLAGALGGWSAAVALLVFTLRSRFELALYAPALAVITGAVAMVTLLTAGALWWSRRHGGWLAGERALGGAASIAGLMLLALLVGLRHPQYRSSDLLLNVHRLEFVQAGNWVFTLPLPGPRALEAPYPPAFYAAMLPFTGLVRDQVLLVEVTAALAVAAGALLTFALARRVTASDGAALWAAAIYAWAPITYAMASAGNFANLFGQALANFGLLALVLTYGRWQRPVVAAGLTASLTLALLGHFGVFLALLLTLPLIVVVLVLPLPGQGRAARGQALALAGISAVALTLSYALYYRFHARLLLGHFQAAVSGQTDARGGAVAALNAGQRLVRLWTDTHLWWGWPALALGLTGAVLLWRARRTPELAIVLVWLGSAVAFAAIDVVAGLSVRWHFFVLPALAVTAGWTLSRLWGWRRVAGAALASLLGAFWLWQGLALWTERVLHAYH